MVFIVKSDDFKIERNVIDSSFSGKVPLKGFPTFYSSAGKYLESVNLWLNYLTNIKKAKNTNSNVRAIKRYWNFLEYNGISWKVFPKEKSFKPTYRYRNDNLLRAVKDGILSASTASSYMLHVIKFYEWALREQLIKLDENSKPFEYEFINISNNGLMSHLNKYFIVKTTDLKIKVPNKGDKQSLNPLSEYEIEIYIKILKEFNEEFVIHQLLQIQSGLRVVTVQFN